jgi:hypothetical protein
MAITVTCIDYILFSRLVPKTPCSMDLYRIYTNAAYDSWLDLCLYPEPQQALGSGSSGGNVIPGVEYCPKCPLGPFLDYTFLKYDTNLFDVPCRTNVTGAINVTGNNIKGTLPLDYCYVSLGHTYDPNFNFNAQFPGFLNHNPPTSCATPFLCPPVPTTSGRRHLLQTAYAPSGTRSGTGTR